MSEGMMGEWNDYTFAEVLVGEVAPLIITTYLFYYYLNYFVTQTIDLTNYSTIKYFEYQTKIIINKKKERN